MAPPKKQSSEYYKQYRLKNIEKELLRHIGILTLAHLNNDGKDERLKTDTSVLINKIIKGERKIDDLEIECASCNLCSAFHGHYPISETEGAL